MRAAAAVLVISLLAGRPVPAAQAPDVAPGAEALGEVRFQTSCAPAVRADFDRAVALLHSFAYAPARQAFSRIAAADPRCAMALWGMAMTRYHQLWEPQVDTPADLEAGAAEIARAAAMPSAPRERSYIGALQQYYAVAESASPALRAQRYADAMAGVARDNPADDEAQIFYALSLIATQAPTDRTHANDLRAAAILEPLWRRLPQHPGLPHYLIHAYDSPELAPRGLSAARAYSRIAPSAPHALHMPAHIFTRLGLWEDSVASNEAARAAARAQGDIGEELHAMDYLTYAYLQLGRFDDAGRIVAEAAAMTDLPAAVFKIGYAVNAMPVRLAVERADWPAAAGLSPRPGSPAKAAAIVYWARALGHARAASPTSDAADITALAACAESLRAAGDVYWASQAEVMLKETQGWSLQAQGEPEAAVARLRAAADEEDAIEKLPVTPGPIVPAREQLGDLLLRLHRPDAALVEFRAALKLAPGRRGARLGEAAAQAAGGAGRRGDGR